MSPEVPASQKSEPTLNTPESLQGCLDLAAIINEQVDLWASRSRSPAMRSRSMAHFIVEDCEPLGREPIDYMDTADFGGSRTREEAKMLTDYEKRREVLSQWAHSGTFDDTPAVNQPLEEYYRGIESFSANPYVPEEFKQAMQSLWRLYIVSEQLALKIGHDSRFDTTNFTALIVRLSEELY